MQNTPKRKKKNKALPLIVLVVIMCVMAVLYFTLAAANDRREAEEAAAAAADTTIMLAEQDYTKITELKYRTDGEWITLLQSGGVWSLAEDPRFPLDQTTAAGMGAAIASIGAMRSVEDGDAALFGLDAPTCEIHVSYGEGTTYKYAIGDRNSFNNAYYFRDDDGSVYMIASGLLSYFQITPEDMIVLDTAIGTLTDTDIVSFTVKDGDAETTVTQTAEEITAEDGTASTVYSEDVTALYDLFCELDLYAWADYYADSTEMAETYGIDGTRSLTLCYKKAVSVNSAETTSADGTAAQTTKVDANYVVYFGSSADGQTYYSPKGSTIVYTAADDVANAILAYAAQ